MDSSEVDSHSMMLYQNRLTTFAGWPYTEQDGAKCTAENLANAGFYRPHAESEPDLARCFMCFKDLEGWEPEDIPEQEHSKRCPNCPFILQRVKDVQNMQIENFVRLCFQQSMQQLQKECSDCVGEINKMKDSKFQELKLLK
uniref:Baculoviral IAP repeat-containing protein 5-like n=1 Tax=Phallusia mammillata TaxID=59560 RepID=A0A6F9D860_9ASCI|nr:baculoviral IAP repeat-containing protein 5-like [Phallusia mammillata]